MTEFCPITGKKKPDPKKAYAWSEKVIYVSCPHCQHDEYLGEGIVIGDTHICEKCNKESEVEDNT